MFLLDARFLSADLNTFTTDAVSKLYAIWHDWNSFSMDCARVSVFKQADEVSFTGLLQIQDCAALETQVGFEVLRDQNTQLIFAHTHVTTEYV